MAHDRQPEYLLRATPWFLTSLGRAALDLAIIFLSCVMKSKMRQALGFAAEARESPDTQALLTCAEKEEENQEARNEDKVSLAGKLWSHNSILRNGRILRTCESCLPSVLCRRLRQLSCLADGTVAKPNT